MAASAVILTGIRVLDNPSPFTAPIQLEIYYYCRQTLPEHITWKVIYLQDGRDGMLLREIWDGPVYPGSRRFLLETKPLDPSRLLESSVLGVQFILLTGSYAGQEFLQLKYIMKNKYVAEHLRMQPPQGVFIQEVQKSILSNHPMITTAPINFRPENAQGGGQAAPDRGRKRRLRSRL